MNSRFKFLKYIVIGGMSAACAPSLKSIQIPLDPVSSREFQAADIEKDIAALNAFIEKNPNDRKTLSDVLLIMDALAADRRGDVDMAVSKWFEALKIASGPLGEKSFYGWVKAFSLKQSENRTKKLDRNQLAKMILQETNDGSIGPWLLERGFQTVDSLVPVLMKQIPELIEGGRLESTAKIDAPTIMGTSSVDPLLIQLANEVCRYKQQFGSGWEQWRSSLKSDVVKYFDALIFQCSGRSQKAIEVFADVAPRMATNAGTVPMALESYSRLIKLRREQGERESLAPLYLAFMQLWKSPIVNEGSLGMARPAFELRRIEDTLWAARARAGVGDSENAKLFASDVISYVNSSLSQSYLLSTQQKNSLVAIAAETNHLIAFRLAVEARDWTTAYNVTEAALEISQLPDEWQGRLQWSLGLYRFMAGDFDQARRIWEQLITNSVDDKLKPMLLFWVSRAHENLGNKTESQFYQKSLVEEYPLSFYSVVALKQSPGDSQERWKKTFEDLPGFRQKVRDWQKLDIDDLRNDPTRGRLLRRAELAAAIPLPQLIGPIFDELQASFDPVKGGERQAIWGLYLSRLYASVGQWQGAISLTTKLTKDSEFWNHHPEQIYIYFPRPYLPHYQKNANDLSLPPEMLLGISRQESSFQFDIKSAANAWGLMQVTPYTAKQLLPAAGLESLAETQIQENLTRPEVNIKLGAILLRDLQVRFAGGLPQMFAAYNAGRNTVDNWVARRLFDDPLLFIEMIPYQETRDYVKAVWRNQLVYEFLVRDK